MPYLVCRRFCRGDMLFLLSRRSGKVTSTLVIVSHPLFIFTLSFCFFVFVFLFSFMYPDLVCFILFTSLVFFLFSFLFYDSHCHTYSGKSRLVDWDDIFVLVIVFLSFGCNSQIIDVVKSLFTSTINVVSPPSVIQVYQILNESIIHVYNLFGFIMSAPFFNDVTALRVIPVWVSVWHSNYSKGIRCHAFIPIYT